MVDSIVRQVVRSGTAIGSNYRAAGRARSRTEFIAKLGVVVKEADETEHWLDLLDSCDLCRGQELVWLRRESAELRAIFTKSVKTARLNHER